MPERGFVVDVERILAVDHAAQPIVFLANPNNPTPAPGSAARALGAAPAGRRSVVLVIDSAYAEFVADPAYTTGLSILVDGTANVVVTRTFSKAYGLAALRVGWGLWAGRRHLPRCAGSTASTSMPSPRRRPWRRSRTAALLLRSVAATNEQRARLADGLRRLGLDVLPSATNFLLVGFGSAEAAASAFEALAAESIHVRPADDYGLPDRLRITIGAPARDQRRPRRPRPPPRPGPAAGRKAPAPATAR